MSAVCASNLHLFVFSQLALMVFRLPTPFESFVPASSDPISLSRPWRGTFSLHGVNLFHPTNGQQRLFVASAETEGNNRIDLWPKQFNVYLTRQSCRLSDIQAWLRTHGTPLCMFMPDRHGSGPASQSNDANFRQLARTMMDNQVICVAPWNDPNRPVGSGILLLPTTSSTGLLVGAIFLDEPFPDFIFNDASHPATAIPAGLPSAYPYPQAFPASASGVSPSSVSPAQRAMSPGPQRFYQAQYDYAAYQYASKPPPNRPFSPLPLSRQPQSDPAFNWPYIEDTSDGSGHTSPGTTYSRP